MKTFTKLILQMKVVAICASFFLISYHAGAQCDSTQCNWIENGSFEDGNTWFTSTYGYDPDGTLNGYPYYDYTITNDALHYSANCGNLFMWVDGADFYPYTGAFWSTPYLTLHDAITYTFCFAAVNVHPGKIAHPIEVRLFDGTSYTSLFTTGNLNTIWTTYSFTFTVPANGNYTIELWETDTTHATGDGNDFGIDCIELRAPCECHLCECRATISLNDFVIDNDGQGFVVLNVTGAIPDPVIKFRVTLVNYHSNVDVECLKCSTAIQEMYGDIYYASPLFGTTPYYAPYELLHGIDYSREVTWCFDHPTHFTPTHIPLKMQFPPVLDLKCCTNDVSFCFRVEFWTNECIACDYLVCWDGGPGHAEPKSMKTIPEEKTIPPVTPQGLKVIPNPASNNFKVVFEKENLGGTLQIFDMNGSLIKETVVTSEDYTVNTRSYAEGMYLIKYQSSKGIIQEKVVIKK